MLREDSLLIGFALGVVVPVLSYLLIEGIFDLLEALSITNRYGQAYSFRQRTLAVIAICGNLLPFRLYANLRNESSMRGVFIATGIYAVGWIIIFGIDAMS